MPPQVLSAENGIVEVLRAAEAPLTVTEVVEKVRAKDGLMERDIRPSFWTLVAAGKVIVDSSFRGKLVR